MNKIESIVNKYPSPCFAMANIPANSPAAAYAKYINDFVEAFLHPFVAGFVKPSDFENRKSLEVELLEKMPNIDPEETKKIIEIALDAYFRKAAKGLYTNRLEKQIIQHNSTPYNVLVQSLERALPNDFKAQLSREQIDEKASKAMKAVNKEREEIANKARDYFTPPNVSQPQHKLQTEDKLHVGINIHKADPDKDVTEFLPHIKIHNKLVRLIERLRDLKQVFVNSGMEILSESLSELETNLMTQLHNLKAQDDLTVVQQNIENITNLCNSLLETFKQLQELEYQKLVSI